MSQRFRLREDLIQKITDGQWSDYCYYLSDVIKQDYPFLKDSPMDDIWASMQKLLFRLKKRDLFSSEELVDIARQCFNIEKIAPLSPEISNLYALLHHPDFMHVRKDEVLLDRYLRGFRLQNEQKTSLILNTTATIHHKTMLHLRYYLENQGEKPIYVFFLLPFYDLHYPENLRVDPRYYNRNRLYTYRAKRNIIGLSKRFWPDVRLPLSKQNIPLLIEIMPGQSLAESFMHVQPFPMDVIGWPAQKTDRSMAKELVRYHQMIMSFGYIDDPDLVETFTDHHTIANVENSHIGARHKVFSLKNPENIVAQKLAHGPLMDIQSLGMKLESDLTIQKTPPIDANDNASEEKLLSTEAFDQGNDNSDNNDTNDGNHPTKIDMDDDVFTRH